MNNNKNLNTLRYLGVESINKANSGHPGIVLGAAPMMFELFTKHITTNPDNPLWINRDRFVLSAGHGSGLIYSMLHLCGFKLSIDDLKQFRQLNSLTPGHPEYMHTEGIDATTGPLGQGVAMAVGMALAEEFLSSKYNKKDFKIIDHYTFVLCGDGDLQEGVFNEAISFAGRQKLKKLILLHDSNDIQLDAPVSAAQSEDTQMKFKACGWNTILVKDGENLEEISKAINAAKKQDKPTYIEVKTIIGIGATNQGTQKVHGAPLGSDIETVKKALNIQTKDFEVEKSVYDFFDKEVKQRGIEENKKWTKMFEEYKSKYFNEAKEFENSINQNWDVTMEDFKDLNHNNTQATRVSSGEVLSIISKKIPNMLGGSADLTESTKAKGADGNFDVSSRSSRNIMYGVREFAMAAINNGLALHKGVLPFASGFFVFSDYMKPAIRLSSLMKLQTLYIFTHDSIAVGEDGPTHQPIEQLTMIRSIPNISLYRPCDMKETQASYISALKDKSRPSVIIATRQNLIELKHSSNILDDVKKGAYIIDDCFNAEITLIATGSEVKLAIDVKKILEKSNKKVRVVSMVNQNLFNEQNEEYKNSIIDKSTQRYSIELGSTYGWSKYTGDNGINFGIDSFGYSAPFENIIKFIGFTPEQISKKILEKN